MRWASAGYAGLRAEQGRRRERGDVVQLGLGVSSYVEITAADANGGETARIVVHDDGSVTVYTGSSPHGQGHQTAWAMLVEAELGIEMSKVRVVHGDTDLIPAAVGTYGSRSLQLGGVAVQKAAVEVKEHARQLAAELASEKWLVARVVVKIRYVPFFTYTRSRTLAEPTTDVEPITTAALEALERLDRRDPIRLLGVRADLAPLEPG